MSRASFALNQCILIGIFGLDLAAFLSLCALDILPTKLHISFVWAEKLPGSPSERYLAILFKFLVAWCVLGSEEKFSGMPPTLRAVCASTRPLS
jgi:hypothetical protein